MEVVKETALIRGILEAWGGAPWKVCTGGRRWAVEGFHLWNPFGLTDYY